ncbi:hypothetical protein [Pontibacter sp. H249]|uniref:hypothetical protein n=1 Tax=Pontibacter sp. H249 TaxID=3133420 RepID=UPI0030C2C79E
MANALFQTRVYVARRGKPDLSGYSLILLLCGLIVYLLNTDEWYSIPFLLASAALFNFQRYYYDSGRQELNGYLGRYLIIKTDSILVCGREYPFREIEDLLIEVRDYDGEKKVTAYTVSTVRGVNNHVRFRQRGKAYEFPFYIESEQHQNALKTVLNELMDHGVNMKVYFKNARSTVS